MALSVIVAMDKNKLIGKENSLPWSLHNDLRFVKEKTTGNTIVMGRKTYDSIGRPLPNRKNVIITRDENLVIEGCTIINYKEDIYKVSEGEIFVFGGSEIFELYKDDIEKIYLTYIDHSFEGDSYFPLDLEEYIEVSREKGLKDNKNPYDYYFIELVRK